MTHVCSSGTARTKLSTRSERNRIYCPCAVKNQQRGSERSRRRAARRSSRRTEELHIMLSGPVCPLHGGGGGGGGYRRNVATDACSTGPTPPPELYNADGICRPRSRTSSPLSHCRDRASWQSGYPRSATFTRASSQRNAIKCNRPVSPGHGWAEPGKGWTRRVRRVRSSDESRQYHSPDKAAVFVSRSQACNELRGRHGTPCAQRQHHDQSQQCHQHRRQSRDCYGQTCRTVIHPTPSTMKSSSSPVEFEPSDELHPLPAPGSDLSKPAYTQHANHGTVRKNADDGCSYPLGNRARGTSDPADPKTGASNMGACRTGADKKNCHSAEMLDKQEATPATSAWSTRSDTRIEQVQSIKSDLRCARTYNRGLRTSNSALARQVAALRSRVEALAFPTTSGRSITGEEKHISSEDAQMQDQGRRTGGDFDRFQQAGPNVIGGGRSGTDPTDATRRTARRNQNSGGVNRPSRETNGIKMAWPVSRSMSETTSSDLEAHTNFSDARGSGTSDFTAQKIATSQTRTRTKARPQCRLQTHQKDGVRSTKITHAETQTEIPCSVFEGYCLPKQRQSCEHSSSPRDREDFFSTQGTEVDLCRNAALHYAETDKKGNSNRCGDFVADASTTCRSGKHEPPRSTSCFSLEGVRGQESASTTLKPNVCISNTVTTSTSLLLERGSHDLKKSEKPLSREGQPERPRSLSGEESSKRPGSRPGSLTDYDAFNFRPERPEDERLSCARGLRCAVNSDSPRTLTTDFVSAVQVEPGTQMIICRGTYARDNTGQEAEHEQDESEEGGGAADEEQEQEKGDKKKAECQDTRDAFRSCATDKIVDAELIGAKVEQCGVEGEQVIPVASSHRPEKHLIHYVKDGHGRCDEGSNLSHCTSFADAEARVIRAHNEETEQSITINTPKIAVTSAGSDFENAHVLKVTDKDCSQTPARRLGASSPPPSASHSHKRGDLEPSRSLKVASRPALPPSIEEGVRSTRRLATVDDFEPPVGESALLNEAPRAAAKPCHVLLSDIMDVERLQQELRQTKYALGALKVASVLQRRTSNAQNVFGRSRALAERGLRLAQGFFRWRRHSQRLAVSTSPGSCGPSSPLPLNKLDDVPGNGLLHDKSRMANSLPSRSTERSSERRNYRSCHTERTGESLEGSTMRALRWDMSDDSAAEGSDVLAPECITRDDAFLAATLSPDATGVVCSTESDMTTTGLKLTPCSDRPVTPTVANTATPSAELATGSLSPTMPPLPHPPPPKLGQNNLYSAKRAKGKRKCGGDCGCRAGGACTQHEQINASGAVSEEVVVVRNVAPLTAVSQIDKESVENNTLDVYQTDGGQPDEVRGVELRSGKGKANFRDDAGQHVLPRRDTVMWWPSPRDTWRLAEQNLAEGDTYISADGCKGGEMSQTGRTEVQRNHTMQEQRYSQRCSRGNKEEEEDEKLKEGSRTTCGDRSSAEKELDADTSYRRDCAVLAGAAKIIYALRALEHRRLSSRFYRWKRMRFLTKDRSL